MITIYYLKGTKQGCRIFYSDDLSPKLVEVIDLNISSTKALQEYAAFYHHTIEDSQKMIRKRYKFNQKVPVFIEKDRSLFFPTTSKTQRECCWVNYYAVARISKQQDHSKILFHELNKKFHFTVHSKIPLALQRDEFEVVFDLDVRILKKQMKRCTQIAQDLVKEEMSKKVGIHICRKGDYDERKAYPI